MTLDDEGKIIEWFGAASNITGLKQAEEVLREAGERSEQQKDCMKQSLPARQI